MAFRRKRSKNSYENHLFIVRTIDIDIVISFVVIVNITLIFFRQQIVIKRRHYLDTPCSIEYL